MEGSPEQLHPESEQDREERLYADLLATESEASGILAQLGTLLRSRADKTEIEAMSDRYEDALQHNRHALDRWLEYVNDVLHDRA